MFKRTRSAYDFAEEIQAHLDLEADDLRAKTSAQKKRIQARVAFGSLPRAREAFYLI